MDRNWLMKSGVSFLMLALMIACSPDSEKNDDNNPQNTDSPGNEDPSIENTRYDDVRDGNDREENKDDSRNPDTNHDGFNHVPNKNGSHNIQRKQEDND